MLSKSACVGKACWTLPPLLGVKYIPELDKLYLTVAVTVVDEYRF